MHRVHSLLLFLLFSCLPFQARAQECRPVGIYTSYRVQSAYIESPGRYCLTLDLTQPRLFDIHAGSFKSFSGNSFLTIACGYAQDCSTLKNDDFYHIDLQGHVMKAEVDNMVGIDNQSGGLQVSIKNGSIDVPGHKIPNAGIWLRGEGNPMRLPGSPQPGQNSGKRCWPTELECEDIAAADTLDKKPPSYRVSNYLVANIKIRAGWRGVVMGGGNNILRNSTIEVDGHTAVYMYGPSSVIENNTIIIHGQGQGTPFDAAIKLRDAHGAVVRNNRIIYKGMWFTKAPAAINLLDATGVLIEGNTVENFDSLVRVNGASDYTEKAGNKTLRK